MNGKVGSDHMVIEPQIRDLETQEEEELQIESRSTTRPRLTIRGYLRHVRLQLLPLLAGCFPTWKNGEERRKVALYHSRLVGAVYSSLHLLPLGAAIALLVLQWTSYLASYTRDDSTTLQFVAKLHELFMQMSLAEIIICIIRAESVTGFVPLGILSGIDRATQLSYLWSLDFWSTLRSSVLCGWRGATFIVALFALVLLTSLVGPSSAVLMIPRAGSSHISKTVTLYGTVSNDAKYPPILGTANGLDLNITEVNTIGTVSIDNDYESPTTSTLAARYVSFLNDDRSTHLNFPEVLNTPDPFYNRVVRVSNRRVRKLKDGVEVGSSISDMFGVQVNITLPTLFSTATLQAVLQAILSDNGTANIQGSLASRNGTVTVEMAHPVVVTERISSSIALRSDSAIPYVMHGQGQPNFMLADYSTLDKLAEEASRSTEHDDQSQYHAPVWGPSVVPGSSSLVGTFITTKKLDGNSSASLSQILNSTSLTSQIGSADVVTCTISATWELGQILLQQIFSSEAVKTASYAQRRSPYAQDMELKIADNDPVRSAQLHRQLMLTHTKWADPSKYILNWEQASFPLGSMFALAISKIPQPVLPYRFPGVLAPGLLWYPPPSVDPTNISEVVFKMINHGYGYGTRSTSIYLAMTVILLYCIITFTYMTYTIVTGSASTAWNSGIELVTLALQSRKPDLLGHASVGIDSVKTFSEGVGIRVNRDDELELVFANDRGLGTRRLRKIERNKEY